MTGMELCTAAQYGIGMKVIIINNDFQGMVKQWQDLFYEERYSHTRMHNPDFVKMAEAMNCVGMRCDRAADLPGVMAEFLACDEPVVLDCVVEKHEHVYLDTAFLTFFCPRMLPGVSPEELIAHAAHIVGAEKVLYGCEGLSPDAVRHTDLTDDEKRLILGGNAIRLLGIERSMAD